MECKVTYKEDGESFQVLMEKIIHNLLSQKLIDSLKKEESGI